MLDFSSSWVLRGLLALGLSASATAGAQAQTVLPFTPGNFVVVRVGDGSGSLSSASTATFLLEYAPDGTLVQTVPLPTASSGSQAALTETGTSTTDGSLTRSQDGRYVVLTGYNTPPGTASLSGTTAATVNRVVGRIGGGGDIDTSTKLSDAFGGTTVRGAATADGESFYVVGGNSGVVYVPLGNTAASTSLNTGLPTNLRSVVIAGGNLFVSSGSGAFVGVSQVGTGLPTAAPQTVVLLPGFAAPAGTTQAALSPNGFFFADLSADVAGPDVLYVADDGNASTVGGGLEKWSLVGGTWVLNGVIGQSAGAGLRGVAGSATAGVVTMAASGTTGFYVLTDAGGYNAAPSTTALPKALATAGTGSTYRGVSLAPTIARSLATQPGRLAGLAAYPSPAHGLLTVALPQPGPATAELLDLAGRTVLAPAALPASGQLRLPASLAAGTYLLRVRQAGNAAVRRVVLD